MAKDVIDYQPTDTSTTDSNAIVGQTDNETFQLINNTSVTVDYEFEGTHDSDGDFSDAVSLGSGSVSASSTARDSVSDPWDQIRVKLTPQTSPGGSSSVIVKKHISE